MQSEMLDIKKFLVSIRTRIRLFSTVSSIVSVIAVISCFFVPKLYEATSTVFIERNVINNLMQGITVSPSMDDRIRVLKHYMLSRDLVTRTLVKMDLDNDPRYINPENFQQLVKKSQEQTKIKIEGKDLFFISMVDYDPRFAKDFINTLVNIYVEENLSDKREESYGANRFITEQVSLYKNKLDEIDEKILEFRKKTGIYSSVNEASLMSQIARDEELLSQIKSQKTESHATISTINSQIEMLRSQSNYGYSSSQIERLQADIKQLLLTYNEQFPAVIKLRAQLEELQNRKQDQKPSRSTGGDAEEFNPLEDPIYVDLKVRLNSAQSALNALDAREKDLKASINANQSLLRNFPADKKTLSDLERERQTQATLYEELLQRVNVSEVSKQMEVADKATNFRIVDPAILTGKTVGMSRVLMMLFAFMAGIVAGLVVVYAAEQFDGSFRGAESIKGLGVAVLAEIPFIWSDIDLRQARRKNIAAVCFAACCTTVVGLMIAHEILGMTYIDRIIEDLNMFNNLS